MKGIVPRSLAIVALAALTFPLILLFAPVDQAMAMEAPAPCHQEHPAPSSPMGSHHDCCLVGHNHLMPAHAVGAQPIQSLIVGEISAVALPILSHERPEPALSSFDPPLDSPLPLRI